MGSPSVSFPPSKSLVGWSCQSSLPHGYLPLGTEVPTHTAGLSLQRRGVGGSEAKVVGGWWLGGGCFLNADGPDLAPLKVLLPVRQLFQRGGDRPRRDPGPGSGLLSTATWVQPVCSATFSNINILINSRPIILFVFLFS